MVLRARSLVSVCLLFLCDRFSPVLKSAQLGRSSFWQRSASQFAHSTLGRASQPAGHGVLRRKPGERQDVELSKPGISLNEAVGPAEDKQSSLRAMWDEASAEINWAAEAEPATREAQPRSGQRFRRTVVSAPPNRAARREHLQKTKTQRRKEEEQRLREEQQRRKELAERPTLLIQADPLAQKIAQIFEDHRARKSGLDAAEDAIWAAVPSKLSECSNAALAALVRYAGATLNVQTIKAEPLWRLGQAMSYLEAHQEPGEQAHLIVLFANVHYLRALLRRAISMRQKLWFFNAQELRLVVGFLADPWERIGGATADDDDAAEPNKTSKARLYALESIENRRRRMEYRKTAFETAQDAFQRWHRIVANQSDWLLQSKMQDLHALQDLLLVAAASYNEPDIAGEIMDMRAKAGIAPVNRTYSRLMEVARGAKDEPTAHGIANRAWQAYNESREMSQSGGNDDVSRADQAEHELYLWADRIGFLMERDHLVDAVDLLERVCSGEVDSVSPDDIPGMLERVCFFQPTEIVSSNICAFVATCRERRSIQPFICDPRVLGYILGRLITDQDLILRLDEMRNLMLLAIEFCPPADETARLVSWRAVQVIDCYAAAAFGPGVNAKTAQIYIEQAMVIYSALTAKFGLVNKVDYVHKMADVLALVGQHGDAVALVRESLQLLQKGVEAAGERDADRATARRLRAQLMLECALGFHVVGAAPSLQDLLDACAVLFAMQPKDDLRLSALLQQSVRRAIAQRDARELVEYLQGERGRLMYWVSQAKVDSQAYRHGPFRFCSRAGGQRLDDELYFRGTEGLLARFSPPFAPDFERNETETN